MTPHREPPEIELRWNQGSLLTCDTVNALAGADVLPSEWERGGYALAISHPCDLAADIKVEPYIEFMLAMPIERPDGNYSYGKSARTLHVDAAIDNRPENLAISIHNHARVDQANIGQPEAQLDKHASQLVARWVSRRYVRSAFPDAFNERVRSQRSAIRNLLKREGHKLSGIYIYLSSEEELDESTEYEIAFRATMTVADYDDEDVRTRCGGVIDELAKLFDAADGVEVVDHELCNEASTSLDDLRFYQRWDVDDLTLRDESAPLAPDG